MRAEARTRRAAPSSAVDAVAARDVEAEPVGPASSTGTCTTRRPRRRRSVREAELAHEGRHRLAVLPGECAVRVHQPRPARRRSPLRSLRRDLAAAEAALRLPSGVSEIFHLVERQIAERGVEAQIGHASRRNGRAARR